MSEREKASECENRWRLEQAVHVSEQRLQELTREACALSSSAEVERSLPSHLRVRFKRDKIETWDVSLCSAVLKGLRALHDKKQEKAVAAIVRARNCCAHAVGGRVTSVVFEQHYAACVRAYEVLGGDAAALQRLRTCEVDTSDIRVLSCSQEATKAATSAKAEGNRLFCADEFRAAAECYTKGLQVAGVVDPTVLSQLLCNRSAARFHLQELANAKEDAKQAAELAPQWFKPQLRLAAIYDETFNHHKAVARLEMALGLASAANEDTAVEEIEKKMPEYRLRRDEAARREGENLAYGPMHANEGAFRDAVQARFGLNETQDPMALVDNLLKLDLDGAGMSAKKHVLLGQRAFQDGRLTDSAREFMAAAMGGDPEGMYNYALALLKGRGTRKNVSEAIRWLNKAAATSPTNDGMSAGIGEANASLGNFYNAGIYFHEDKVRAREYWERAADLGAPAGLNQFGLCLMYGTHGVPKDLPRARETFRRSAELLHNEAMSNLAGLHASLHEYETAARWADAACRFGFFPAAKTADQLRKLAAARESLPQKVLGILDMDTTPRVLNEPRFQRQNTTPTLDELRAIDTSYGKRLLSAKKMMLKAMQHLTSSDPDDMIRAVQLAAKAHRIEDATLVFSKKEMFCAKMLVSCLQDVGVLLNSDMALLLQPPDASAFVAFWKSMQLQFPEDLMICRRAACAYMFKAYAGADIKRGVQLFQRALGLLPHPDDDRDPQTIGVLYEAAAAYYQTEELERAEVLFGRFLNHAPADGHRKVPEAHFILGLIALSKITDGPQRTKKQTKGVIKKAGNVAAAHLREGVALLEHVPPFLRGDSQESPNRRALERMLMLIGETPLSSGKATAESPNAKKWGGEFVSGPRRHLELRSDTSMLRSMWRKSIAIMAESAYNIKGRTKISSSTTPVRQSTVSSKANNIFTPATIDELFSALKDHVFTGRVIECIVVSVPSFNGSSFQFVIEDSQREPARIAVYDAPQLLVAQLVPGRALRLLNPYVRLANDGSIMLRVDNPSSTIEVQTLHAICWVCEAGQQPGEALKKCAKCHKALYCSKRCQTQDWSVDGHRFLCAAFRKS
ncbi:hypothetical protein PRIC1_008271 [Phytophthora ramorum]